MQRRDGAVTIQLDESLPTKDAGDRNGNVRSSARSEAKLTPWQVILGLTQFVFHIAVTVFYARAIYLDWTHYTPILIDYELVDEDLYVYFQGIFYKVSYISNICEVLQLVYFFWCCITDLVTASAPRSSIGRTAVAFRDWFLASIVFPIGTIVVTTFWAIYSIDRELIFPAKLDQFFPSWLNHALHTFVLPLLLVDMLLVKHKYPSRVTGMISAILFALCYLLWVLYLGFAKDIWVYPFFKVLEGPYFILFFAGMSLVLVFFYILGEKLSGFLGGSRKEVSSQKLD